MSLPITLLKQNNLIIKGYLYRVINPPPEETLDCMELLFTLLVNGKMVEFTNSFVIGSSGADGASVGLENDGEWFLIVRILYSLGYYVDENMKVSDNIKDSRQVIEKWIQELKFQKGEQEDMFGTLPKTEFIGATPLQYQYPNMSAGGLTSLGSWGSGSATGSANTPEMRTAVN